MAAPPTSLGAVSPILYEYPFNERVRTLLRLEDLFDRLDFFCAQQHPLQHHVALVTLFELADVASRADMKSDLLQELERQRQALMAFQDAPGVSTEALARILADIDDAWQQLSTSVARGVAPLRDNEWLKTVRSRSSIPGGTSEFDLPTYHAWQHRSPEARQGDLDGWIAPFMPLRNGLRLVLGLLRQSGQASVQVAEQGGFQQTLGGKQYQMLRIRLDAELEAVPEISANKYQLWVRFNALGPDMRVRPMEAGVPFELTLCNF